VKCIDLDSEFAVGANPMLDDFDRLERSGFKAIVDLRIPGEVGGLDFTTERKVAAARGMVVLHIPVPARTFPTEALDRFRQEVATLPRRIFVHCTKGARAALFTGVHLGLERGATEDEIMAGMQALDLCEESDAYDEPVRAYIQQAREVYSHLAESIW
jgi:uncharacterized protein (TIGR01244 family)